MAITHAELAQKCARLAGCVSRWASDLLELEGLYNAHASPEVVEQLLNDIRQRIAHIERRALEGKEPT